MDAHHFLSPCCAVVRYCRAALPHVEPGDCHHPAGYGTSNGADMFFSDVIAT
jgi:hypothetical protein